jgi:hypothetical protein
MQESVSTKSTGIRSSRSHHLPDPYSFGLPDRGPVSLTAGIKAELGYAREKAIDFYIKYYHNGMMNHMMQTSD